MKNFKEYSLLFFLLLAIVSIVFYEFIFGNLVFIAGDALSGQSVFELVLWTPLTKVFDSNSMYLFPPNVSKKILLDMPKHEKKGMGYLYDKYKES